MYECTGVKDCVLVVVWMDDQKDEISGGRKEERVGGRKRRKQKEKKEKKQKTNN